MLDDPDPPYVEAVDYTEPEIDREARRLDDRPVAERVSLRRRTYRRLVLVVVGYLALLVASAVFLGGVEPGAVPAMFVPSVLLAGFVFETLDSASGMGFGTSLSPLLFSLGYTPLEVFAVGLPIDYQLLPSLLTGAVLAAIVAPYLVRVLPGRLLEDLIPIYAFPIGAVAPGAAL